MDPFRNEEYHDFSAAQPAANYRAALERERTLIGQHHPLTIAGEHVDTDRRIESINPCNPSEVLGSVAQADTAHAEAALAAAWAAYPGWSRSSAVDRAGLMTRLAAALRDRRLDLAARMTLESAKNWAEADADVAEAIDFCEYYARLALDAEQPVAVGRDHETRFIPIGAGVAIPPWNFPLAILVGLTAGPVAAGNTVVLKPASNTVLIGAAFMDAVNAVGFPPGVINFLPGAGAEVGDTLVDHPTTRFINFTGSKEVGLRIAERAAKVHEGQRWIKRAFLEMGGKDGLIVDETADLDYAADAAVRSAFGFQGQKCSAASRLIAVDAVHDALVDKVVEKSAALDIGLAEDNASVNSVISAAQHNAIVSEIEAGKSEGTLVTGGGVPDRDGYFIEPTVFVDVDRQARLAQHEIFGPVLSVMRARDFDDALDIGNSTEFGLTGGIISNDKARIERAKREFHVGNLYVNRKITGALVGREPFGGFNMSGTNSKAGGPGYVKLFMEQKTVSSIGAPDH